LRADHCPRIMSVEMLPDASRIGSQTVSTHVESHARGRSMRRLILPAFHRTLVPVSTMLLAGLVGCASLTGPARPAECSVPDATAPRSVIVEVPEVYELANIILALTQYQALAPHTVWSGPYLTQVRSHFDSLRNHPLIAALNARLTSGGSWNYDAYYGFRENSFVYQFGSTGLTHVTGYTRAWGGTDLFSQEIRRVEDFANRSGFRAFYADHASFYADQIRRYQDLVSVDRMWRWLETRFPDRYDRYRIVFSPLINGSHSTQRFTTAGVRETVMFIAGPDVLRDTSDARLRTAQLERLVFTEIDHNYVNPATNRYEGVVRRIFSDVSAWNGDVNNYRSPVATFNEYMTWAVFNLYAREAYDPATAAAIRENVIRSMLGRRFGKFREFEQQVMDVYLAAGSQPCVPNLYGAILGRAAALR
jgi:hypothetical protein